MCPHLQGEGLSADGQNNGVSIYRLSLLENLILVSPQYPSFEREVIHPIMGKVAVTLTRSLDSLVKSDLPDIQVLVGLPTLVRSLLELTS